MEASALSKLIVILFIAGTVIFIVGFSTNYWVDNDFSHSGLWRFCNVFLCVDAKAQINIFEDGVSWFEAVQAFETIGFIAAIAALVLIVLYIFVPATSGKRIVFILTMLACFAAAGCIILGIIIYGAKVENNLSWSFALCTIAGIIFGICGILLVVDMLKR